jgi:hypothetical protein
VEVSRGRKKAALVESENEEGETEAEANLVESENEEGETEAEANPKAGGDKDRHDQE